MNSTVEANVSIMCACALTLKPFIRRFFPNILKSSAGQTKSNSGISASGSRTVRKTWRASKAAEANAWSQFDDQTRDGTYLELGEGGISETIIHPQANTSDSQLAVGPGDEGKIIRTIGVDVYETDRWAYGRP